MAPVIWGCSARSVPIRRLMTSFSRCLSATRFARALGMHWQVADRGENALEFERGLVLRSQRVDDRSSGGFENRPVALRVKRKTVFVVLDVETTAFHLQT